MDCVELLVACDVVESWQDLLPGQHLEMSGACHKHGKHEELVRVHAEKQDDFLHLLLKVGQNLQQTDMWQCTITSIERTHSLTTLGPNTRGTNRTIDTSAVVSEDTQSVHSGQRRCSAKRSWKYKQLKRPSNAKGMKVVRDSRIHHNRCDNEPIGDRKLNEDGKIQCNPNMDSDNVTGDHVPLDQVTGDHKPGDHVTGDDHVTADHVTDDHVTGDDHVTDDHVTADHVTADHVTDDHVTGDDLTDTNNDSYTDKVIGQRRNLKEKSIKQPRRSKRHKGSLQDVHTAHDNDSGQELAGSDNEIKYTGKPLPNLELELLREEKNWAKIFQCRLCSDVFSNGATRLRHETYYCTNNPQRIRAHYCGDCSHIFNSRSELTEHRDANHSGIRYTCELCGCDFKTKAGMYLHKMTKHSDRAPKHTCPHCEKGFHQIGQYKEHLTTHSVDRNFQCEVCGKQFKHQSQVRNHKRIVHEGKYRYHCDRCGHGIDRKRKLDTHICGNIRRSHDGDTEMGPVIDGKQQNKGRWEADVLPPGDAAIGSVLTTLPPGVIKQQSTLPVVQVAMDQDTIAVSMVTYAMSSHKTTITDQSTVSVQTISSPAVTTSVTSLSAITNCGMSTLCLTAGSHPNTNSGHFTSSPALTTTNAKNGTPSPAFLPTHSQTPNPAPIIMPKASPSAPSPAYLTNNCPITTPLTAPNAYEIMPGPPLPPTSYNHQTLLPRHLACTEGHLPVSSQLLYYPSPYSVSQATPHPDTSHNKLTHS